MKRMQVAEQEDRDRDAQAEACVGLGGENGGAQGTEAISGLGLMGLGAAGRSSPKAEAMSREASLNGQR